MEKEQQGLNFKILEMIKNRKIDDLKKERLVDETCYTHQLKVANKEILRLQRELDKYKNAKFYKFMRYFKR